MKEIIIIGSGGLGKEAVDLVNSINEYNILGFLDDDLEKKGKFINDVLVLDEVKNIYKYRNVENIVIAIANPKIKREIYEKLKIIEKENDIKFKFPNIIHPTALIGNKVKMGKGNIICSYTIISTAVEIKDFITINPQSGIGHDNIIEDYTTLYWNVNTGGNCHIGKSCELGTKATVLQNLNVVKNTIIGSGAVVVEDIIENGTYVGIPAKKIK